MLSIIIPAHNEEPVIGRLLSGLLAHAEPGELDIVVVPNGCSDATAEVAASHGPDVTVVTTPLPSKAAALRLGDETARSFPRIYADADIVLRTSDIRALGAAVQQPGVLAAGPTRIVELGGATWPVRWWYDVWQQLPEVRAGLFARGVIAVSREGRERLGGLPEVMADDLVMATAFASHERRVVPDARVIVYGPRCWEDLLRRRTRSATGNTEAAQLDPGRSQPRTSSRDLARLSATHPWLCVKVPVFLTAALVSRRRARRAVRAGDYTTWLRDDSSRARS